MFIKDKSGTYKMLIVIVLVMIYIVCWGQVLWAQDSEDYTTEFALKGCKFKTTGSNPYYILEPGYQLILEGEDEGEIIDLKITVLNETQDIFLDGIGRIKTRVVEEREWIDGEIEEVSRNFFAICKNTNSVYYFGEDVDIYEDGDIISHEGAWKAGEDGALPGLIMPGMFLLGSRYYHEIAPEVAMDRAENTTMGVEFSAGDEIYCNCVEVTETSALDQGESIKLVHPTKAYLDS